MTFSNLHEQNIPLLICNVWDAASAKTAEKLNFRAIGTSSAAVAAMLGYEDGEQMCFSELVYIVKRIIATTSLPLTVDIEAGFSQDPIEIAQHIRTLVDLGVVGINIEDSSVTHERKLLDATAFSKNLLVIKQQLIEAGVDVFINVRTDPFLLGHANALEATRERIKLYESTGIDGIFVPCLSKESDISAVVQQTDLPVNVMCVPGLPDFIVLEKLGVKRISMGNFLFSQLSLSLENSLRSVLESRSFNPAF